MKTRYTFHTVLLIALLLGGLFHFSACTSDSKRAETQISVSTPPRPAGQTDVVGLTCEPIETVRIGFIGLGARGTEAIRRFTYQKGIQVKALCDLNQFRVDSCQNMLSRANMPEAAKSRLMEQYKDPIIKDMEERAKEVGGHGGMDFIMDSRLIYCLHNGLPLDMDVYDLAEWCSLIPLTKLSIENGSVPVEVPDFTRGAWNKIQGYRHAFAQ